MLAGYGDPHKRGQIKCESPLNQNGLEGTTVTKDLISIPYFNVVSCIPIVNLFIGIYHLMEGVFEDGSQYNVSHVKWQFKVMRAGVGLLEITLVGGWLVHGIATIYFKNTEPALN